MKEEQIKTKVLTIIKKIIKSSTGEEINIKDDVSLINSGLIDSLGMVVLIEALVKKFHINIDFSELSADNFENIDSVVKFVIHKKSEVN